MRETEVEKYTYEYDWETVVESYLRRFPKHERIPVLLNSFVEEDSFDEEKKIRVIKRRCHVDIEAPTWLKKTFNTYEMIFCQITNIDYGKRSMKIENLNVTYRNKVQMNDFCEYRAMESNPNFTYFEQYARLELPNFPFSNLLEQYAAKSYSKNTSRGREIDVLFIKDVLEDRKKKGNTESNNNSFNNRTSGNGAANNNSKQTGNEVKRKSASFIEGDLKTKSNDKPESKSLLAKHGAAKKSTRKSTKADRSAAKALNTTEASFDQMNSEDPLVKITAILDRLGPLTRFLLIDLFLIISPMALILARGNFVAFLLGNLMAVLGMILSIFFHKGGDSRLIFFFIQGSVIDGERAIALTNRDDDVEIIKSANSNVTNLPDKEETWLEDKGGNFSPIEEDDVNDFQNEEFLEEEEEDFPELPNDQVINEEDSADSSSEQSEEDGDEQNNNLEMEEDPNNMMDDIEDEDMVALSGGDEEERETEQNFNNGTSPQSPKKNGKRSFFSRNNKSKNEPSSTPPKPNLRTRMFGRFKRSKSTGSTIKSGSSKSNAIFRYASYVNNQNNKLGREDFIKSYTLQNNHFCVIKIPSWTVKLHNGQGLIFYAMQVQLTGVASESSHCYNVYKTFDEFAVLIKNLQVLYTYLKKNNPNLANVLASIIPEESKLALPKVLKRRLYRKYPTALQNLVYPDGEYNGSTIPSISASQAQQQQGKGNSLLPKRKDGSERKRRSLSLNSSNSSKGGNQSDRAHDLQEQLTGNPSDVSEDETSSGLLFQFSLLQDYRRIQFENLLNRLISTNRNYGMLREEDSSEKGANASSNVNNSGNTNTAGAMLLSTTPSLTRILTSFFLSSTGISSEESISAIDISKIEQGYLSNINNINNTNVNSNANTNTLPYFGLFYKAKSLTSWTCTLISLEEEKLNFYNVTKGGHVAGIFTELLEGNNSLINSIMASYFLRLKSIKGIRILKQCSIPVQQCLQIELKDYSSIYLSCESDTQLNHWASLLRGKIVPVAGEEEIIAGILEGFGGGKTLSNGLYPISSGNGKKSYYKAPIFSIHTVVGGSSSAPNSSYSSGPNPANMTSSAASRSEASKSPHNNNRIILNKRYLHVEFFPEGDAKEYDDSYSILFQMIPELLSKYKSQSQTNNSGKITIFNSADSMVLLSKRLLELVLEIFQEFTLQKCIINAALVLKLQKLGVVSSFLQCCRVDLLGGYPNRTVFFINLYHALLLHAYLDIGRPGTRAMFDVFSSRVCYYVGEYCFSLQELDSWFIRIGLTPKPTMAALVVRAAAASFIIKNRKNKSASGNGQVDNSNAANPGGGLNSNPNSSSNDSVLPKFLDFWDPRKSMVISKSVMNDGMVRDPRLHLVLNNGTQSCLYHVYIFGVENLNSQLLHATLHYFDEQVHIDFDRRIIYLPRLFQWYSRDFISFSNSNFNAIANTMESTGTSISNSTANNPNEGGFDQLDGYENNLFINENSSNNTLLDSLIRFFPPETRQKLIQFVLDFHGISTGDQQSDGYNNNNNNNNNFEMDSLNNQQAARNAPNVTNGQVTLAPASFIPSLRSVFRIKFEDMQTQMRGVFFRGHTFGDENCSLNFTSSNIQFPNPTTASNAASNNNNVAA